MDELGINFQPSEREKQVLEALSLGYNRNEIANQLRISKHTVDTHRKNLLRKLSARNVAHLVRKSVHYNWLDCKIKTF